MSIFDALRLANSASGNRKTGSVFFYREKAASKVTGGLFEVRWLKIFKKPLVPGLFALRFHEPRAPVESPLAPGTIVGMPRPH